MRLCCHSVSPHIKTILVFVCVVCGLCEKEKESERRIKKGNMNVLKHLIMALIMQTETDSTTKTIARVSIVFSSVVISWNAILGDLPELSVDNCKKEKLTSFWYNKFHNFVTWFCHSCAWFILSIEFAAKFVIHYYFFLSCATRFLSAAFFYGAHFTLFVRKSMNKWILLLSNTCFFPSRSLRWRQWVALNRNKYSPFCLYVYYNCYHLLLFLLSSSQIYLLKGQQQLHGMASTHQWTEWEKTID